MAALRAASRAAAFLLLNLTLVPIYLLALGFGAPARRALVRLWCRATCAILGVTLRVHGAGFRACPTLFVANHVSYIDIPVIGALLDARFIAKSEVASWPLFGQLGQLTQTLFVRRRRRDALIQRNELATRMQHGQSFVLFAEGTSSDGLSVLPFKTSLLSVAEPWVLDRAVAVQSLTLCYVAWRDGTPIGRSNCDLYAWHGDAELIPHLWRVLRAPGVTIEVGFEAPVLSWTVESRKRLGAELQRSTVQRLEMLRREGLAAIPADDDTAMQHA